MQSVLKPITIDRALAIDGWMSPTELTFLARMAQNANVVVEVGSYKGRSTRVLCDNCPGTVYAVDPWNGPVYREDKSVAFFSNDELMQEFEQNTSDCKNLHVIRGTLEDILHIKNVDFLFIDGSHLYEDVKKDIMNGMTMLKSGGILAGHDYTHWDWPGVKKAVDEFFPLIGTVESIWFLTV